MATKYKLKIYMYNTKLMRINASISFSKTCRRRINIKIAFSAVGVILQMSRNMTSIEESKRANRSSVWWIQFGQQHKNSKIINSNSSKQIVWRWFYMKEGLGSKSWKKNLKRPNFESKNLEIKFRKKKSRKHIPH